MEAFRNLGCLEPGAARTGPTSTATGHGRLGGYAGLGLVWLVWLVRPVELGGGSSAGPGPKILGRRWRRAPHLLGQKVGYLEASNNPPKSSFSQPLTSNRSCVRKRDLSEDSKDGCCNSIRRQQFKCHLQGQCSSREATECPANPRQDKEKPMAVRSSNIVAARGTTYSCIST